MKTRYFLNFLGGLMAVSALFSACDDTNDWDTDSAHDRMFRPVKFSADNTLATSATLIWNEIPGTVYYVMQYAEDSLEFTRCLNFESNGLDTIHVTGAEYELLGLESSTRYSVRLKSISALGKPESEWATMTFKTKSEQIFREVAVEDLSFNKVILRWTPGAEVTHLVVNNQEVVITHDDMMVGYIEISGLEPENTYTATIYNGGKQRGKVTFTTTPKVPEADHYIYLTETDSISSSMFDGLTGSVTVVLPAGSAYYNLNTVEIPAGVSVDFFGKAGEKKAIMGIQLLKFDGAHDYIRFTNLEITGKYVDDAGGEVKYDYFFNIDYDCDVELFEFNNCEIHHYNNGAFRTKGANPVIRNFQLTGCTVYEASNGYAFIIVGNGVFEHIVLENSTFYTLNRVIEHAKTENLSTRISGCTFYNVVDAGRYLYDGNKVSPAEGLTIENCIFAKTKTETSKGIRTKSGVTVTINNSYAVADWVPSGNVIKDLTEYTGMSADLFADPENGDFTIKDKNFAGKSTAGAEKWRMIEE